MVFSKTALDLQNKARKVIKDLAWRTPKDMFVSILCIVRRRKIPFISNMVYSKIIRNYYNPLRKDIHLGSEVFLAQYMIPKNAKSFVDIGANWGMWSIFIAEKGYEVYAFEPAPKTFETLKDKTGKFSNIHAYPYAIGEKDTYGQVAIGKEVWDGCVINMEGKETVKVPIRSLDNMNLTNVGVIKIDTEGYEKPILAGAKNLIAREKPRLIIEIHKGTGVALNSYAEELLKIQRIVESLGYSWVTRARRVGLGEEAPFLIAEPKCQSAKS
jgi:FkbM family methyltransferase